jgi:hypothetical protein
VSAHCAHCSLYSLYSLYCTYCHSLGERRDALEQAVMRHSITHSLAYTRRRATEAVMAMELAVTRRFITHSLTRAGDETVLALGLANTTCFDLVELNVCT